MGKNECSKSFGIKKEIGPFPIHFTLWFAVYWKYSKM